MMEPRSTPRGQNIGTTIIDITGYVASTTIPTLAARRNDSEVSPVVAMAVSISMCAIAETNALNHIQFRQLGKYSAPPDFP